MIPISLKRLGKKFPWEENYTIVDYPLLMKGCVICGWNSQTDNIHSFQVDRLAEIYNTDSHENENFVYDEYSNDFGAFTYELTIDHIKIYKDGKLICDKKWR